METQLPPSWVSGQKLESPGTHPSRCPRPASRFPWRVQPPCKEPLNAPRPPCCLLDSLPPTWTCAPAAAAACASPLAPRHPTLTSEAMSFHTHTGDYVTCSSPSEGNQRRRARSATAQPFSCFYPDPRVFSLKGGCLSSLPDAPADIPAAHPHPTRLRRPGPSWPGWRPLTRVTNITPKVEQ